MTKASLDQQQDAARRVNDAWSRLKWDQSYVDAATKLRAKGYTYFQTDDTLGMPRGTAWRILNRERYRQCNRECTQRWVERGGVPIYQGPVERHK